MIFLLIFLSFFNASYSYSSIYKIHSSGLDLSHSSNISTIIFLSGFPDTYETWNSLIPSFQKNYHVVTMALPDYESQDLNSFWGYSIQQMVDNLAQIAESCTDQGSSAIYLVGHDWGAHIVLCLIEKYYNRAMIDKVILLDVGLRSRKDILTDLTSVTYVSYLASAFLISRVSDFLATWLVRLYPWNLIGPCRHHTDIDYASDKLVRVKGSMAYPYFHVLFSIAPQFRPEVPQLFLYGTEKSTMFHSREYLKLLEETSSCQYKRLDGCGHWCHWSQAAQVIEAITSFIQPKESCHAHRQNKYT